VLRRIFGTKRDDMIGGWREMHDEELHNMHSSQNIIRIVKSRRMRWAGYLPLMGRRGIHINLWW
jgi:hypothetical protein